MDKSDGGYIKSFRRSLQNPIFDDHMAHSIWHKLMLHARWQNNAEKQYYNGKEIQIGRGEILCVLRPFAENELKCNYQTLKRCLALFESEDMVMVSKIGKYTKIFIRNYAKYADK